MDIRRCCALGLAIIVVALPAHVSAGLPRGSDHEVVGSIEVSEVGGLGRIEINDDLAAVLQRDEGIVSLVDVSDPAKPKVLGAYDDDARQSLDGDIAFSSDGRYVIYARQTVQFSLDGVHVVDVSDPSAPRIAFYQPAGGTLRVAHHDDGTNEWVVAMDAIGGIVVYRFEPTTGALAPVFASPQPVSSKVGGPSSAGIVIQEDPIEKKTLLYASSGGSGLEIFDFSDPTSPVLVDAWNDFGLAEVEVSVTGKKRTVFAASEYWFDAQQEPVIVRLDASDLGAIKEMGHLSMSCRPEDGYRVQGMTLVGKDLYVAHSTVGLLRFSGPRDKVPSFVPFARASRNDGARVLEGPYVFDVEAAGDHLYVTDAATGVLSLLERTSKPRSGTAGGAAGACPT